MVQKTQHLMISLIYGSSAITPMAEEDLLRLLEVSHQNNAQNGITGMLLYGNGNFLQVLEGDEEAVLSCFERIKQDPRHHQVMTYRQKSITEREFGGWEMAFYNVTPDHDLNDIEGYSSFLNDAPNANHFTNNPSHAYTMLRVFRDGMR